MDPKLFLKLAPQRKQVLSLCVQKSLEILQMPQLDLGQWLIDEIEKNPLLELDSYQKSPRITQDIPQKVSYYEYLLKQINETFLDRKQKRIALMLFEQIDEKGFLPQNLEVKGPTLCILETMQTFEPPGSFARSIKESLLLQLKVQNKEKSASYNLIEECYEDLLHGRFGAIQKKLKQKDLSYLIFSISRLSTNPKRDFEKEAAIPIRVDLKINRIPGGWTVQLIEEDLPSFHIQDAYLNLTPESLEEKASLQEFKTQAKWIFRSLKRRRKLLKQLGKILVIKQAKYLEAKGPLVSLSAKELAEKLAVHESTISRALSGKYAATPRGIVSLRSLITKSPETLSAQDMLVQLVQTEDKANPYTDDQLSKKLKEKGFSIARRTIAKYRNQLKIAPANQRKHLKS